jgi:hypothetical protein
LAKATTIYAEANKMPTAMLTAIVLLFSSALISRPRNPKVHLIFVDQSRSICPDYLRPLANGTLGTIFARIQKHSGRFHFLVSIDQSIKVFVHGLNVAEREVVESAPQIAQRSPKGSKAVAPPVAKKRVFSDEARAKIAAVQKKLWAVAKKAK